MLSPECFRDCAADGLAVRLFSVLNFYRGHGNHINGNIKAPSRAGLDSLYRALFASRCADFLFSHGFVRFLLIINYLCLLTVGFASHCFPKTSHLLPICFPITSQKLPTCFPTRIFSGQAYFPSRILQGYITNSTTPIPSLPTGQAGLAGGGLME